MNDDDLYDDHDPLVVPPPEPERVWVDDNHPVRTGRLLMTLLMAGLDVRACYDAEGNYTPFIDIALQNQGGMPAMVLQIKVTGKATQVEQLTRPDEMIDDELDQQSAPVDPVKGALEASDEANGQFDDHRDDAQDPYK